MAKFKHTAQYDETRERVCMVMREVNGALVDERVMNDEILLTKWAVPGGVVMVEFYRSGGCVTFIGSNSKTWLDMAQELMALAPEQHRKAA